MYALLMHLGGGGGGGGAVSAIRVYIHLLSRGDYDKEDNEILSGLRE